MSMQRTCNTALALLAALGLAACGGGGMGNMFSGAGSQEAAREEMRAEREAQSGTRESIWDLFAVQSDPSTTLVVNRYLWTAALDVLDFLPVENVDPFSGVFTTGFGTPPGGGRPYRATVHVRDGALDARSLNVALVTRSGPASAETTRAVEDAILSRARQLRMQDRRL